MSEMIMPGTTLWNVEHQRWMIWNGQSWDWLQPPQPPTVQQQQVMPRQSVHYEKRPMAHTAHLILTILTCGVWGIFVWLPLGLLHNVSRGRRITTKYR